ncbi:hypothetical protein [Rhodopila sp.]|uniref:hypothetical protein n=1 Tax=Rhodopila sp. TaxID=2480087 RepID=UPI002D189F7B|nr:hypothetical protein [Rhodopila sp.]HVZ08111.1 hypothetical protein [Rhodopila sp.]
MTEKRTGLIWQTIKRSVSQSRASRVSHLAFAILAALTIFWQTANAADLPVVVFGGAGSGFGRTPPTRPDFGELFASPSKWPIGLAATKVFELDNAYVDHAPLADVRRIVEFLNRHHITIALHAAGVKVGADGCGRGIESYHWSPQGNAGTLRRLKALGANVEYLAFDEPMTFGNQTIQVPLAEGGHQKACRYSPEEIAIMDAEVAKDSFDYYPEIKISDSEAINGALFNTAGWVSAMKQWLSAFRNHAGRPIDVVMLDINKNTDWHAQAVAMAKAVQASGVKVGYYINGNLLHLSSNEEWTKAAVESYKEYERIIPIKPYMIEVSAWNRLPSRFLPETSPDTVTYVLMQYVKDHATP